MGKCDTCASNKTCSVPLHNPNVNVKDCGYYITKTEGERRKREADKN